MTHLPWECALPAYCDSGYEIRPLLSSTALQDESEKLGGRLAPLVKTSATLGEAGIYRIFSILDAFTGEHVAMAWISVGDDIMPWKLLRVFGPNPKAKLLPRIVGVANGIATLYTQNDRAQGTLWTEL